MMKKVVLISCSKAKRNVPCPARLLYDASNLFRKSLAYAQCIAQDIYVLSAKYGLVGLDEVIAPYDDTLNDKSADELASWGQRVVHQLSEQFDITKTEFVILSGKSYYLPLQTHLPHISLPLRALSMGERLAKLDRLIALCNSGQDSMCSKLHTLFNAMPRFRWDTIDSISFDSGIYIVFEDGEKYRGLDRIVRVGTHRSDGRLKGRLKDHFLKENKDGSIFRKNIGRAILSKNKHPYLSVWNITTSRQDIINQLGNRYDPMFQKKLEQQISSYIREHFSFICFPVSAEAERLRLEEGIIATLNSASDFTASPEWRGRHSSEWEIAHSGMWLKEGLDGTPLSEDEFKIIESNCQVTQLPVSKISYTKSISTPPRAVSLTTADVVIYIKEKLVKANVEGLASLVVMSGDIHKELGLVSRMPMVCSAMRKLQQSGDKVLYSPSSGNGSRLMIEYFLNQRGGII